MERENSLDQGIPRFLGRDLTADRRGVSFTNRWGIGWARRAEIIRLSFDHDHLILPHPICTAVFDDLAGVEGHGQPDAEGLRGNRDRNLLPSPAR